MTENKTFNSRFIVWMVILLAGLGLGIWGVVTTFLSGLQTWGIGDEVPWGIVTASYVFFVAASAGCITVSLGHALGIKGFDLIIKRGVFLAIITMIAGGLLIVMHVGNPVNLWRLITAPNFGSPLGWLVIFYLLYLILLIIDFYLIHKKDFVKARIFGILAPLSAITVHSTLGSVFGFASVRHYYGGAFAPVYFIVIAVVIGTALLLFVTNLHYKFNSKSMSSEMRSVIVSLGKFLGIAIGVLAIFVIWKNLTGLSNPDPSTVKAYQYMLAGPGAWWYWILAIGLGLLAPLILIINRNTRTPNGIMLASGLSIIGMLAARFDFTIGGQVIPIFEDLQHIQQPWADYAATFTEVSIVVLAFSLTALLYTWGSRKLALEEVAEHV
ncbi:MAG: polysulfide reductase NrfD [Dehalococcoidia bacterium]|nr:MAG: polysulfide reductase NrfD [Dehalococcoidia bacterium]